MPFASDRHSIAGAIAIRWGLLPALISISNKGPPGLQAAHSKIRRGSYFGYRARLAFRDNVKF